MADPNSRFHMPGSIRITTVLADAGYDGGWVHEFVRGELGSRPIIPARIGRPTSKPPKGRWRRVMKQRFEQMNKTYGQSAEAEQIETVNSMWKRLLGSAMRARSYGSQCREIMLRAITLKVMILRCLVPKCAGVGYHADLPSKETLWDRYFTAAPRRLRRYVGRSRIVKRA